jgi:hypothetical protein
MGYKNIKVFNFQHNNTPNNQEWILPYNFFERVVGALRTHPYSWRFNLHDFNMPPLGKVIVYETGAMNEEHKTHLMSGTSYGQNFHI